ncbi:MAG: Mannosyl-glycoprotein endo-beta-N-acetylglucosaminidase [Bacteriophage sp.]|nr:MAG: Mannosyl-glycoprotein endo-beta-N-acetylglucosaminidase [Bacteriophage sp.]
MSKVKEDTAKVDNTAVVKPKVFERLRVTPRKYELVDLGGTPSNDTRTPAERNKDYLHPIKGAKERFKASMSNETNPLVGIERTILPSAAGAALVTTPIALAKGAGYGFGIDKLTGGWGNMVERTTGIPSEIAQYTNPGAIIGGAAGYRLDQKNLLSKFIKGDADLAWNPINKNHWIFNKEARTASNIGMAITNRLAPFLQGAEKLPLKVAAYKTAKRTKGNASVTLSEIKGNPSDYAGASILGGGNLEGRNLIAQYIFGENPIIKRVFFNKATSNIKPISNNEAKRGFSHGDRYEQLYPGIYNRRYEMRSVVPQGRPLKFSSSEFTEYAGNNPIGPIDDVGGHVIKLQMDKGKLKQTSQDMWKFNPADYAKRWNESPNAPDQVRLTKQAALMDKVGTPFILQQSNPIWIEGRSVRQAMKVGGKFTFKKSLAVKDAEKLNGKRDMRKKFVKSSRPTYKRRIRKGQVGMRFVSYVPVSNPIIDYTDITNPINPFSEYYIPTTYNTEQALVVPEREDSKSDTVEETPVVASKPIAEPVVNKPVASKVVNNTANSTWSSPYKDRSKWAADLTNAYKRAGITNDNAIRMLVSQDALESAWGRSAQGKFNFGNLTTGAKWKGDYVTGNDKNAKGEAIKQKFRSYNSMDEYAADKVQFLKRLYDFDENDDINKFVAKLTGSNKGKRRYAEARNYAKLLTGVYNGISKGQNGLVVQRRDATYVSPTYHNSPYRDVNYKPTSEIEIVSPKWTMQDGRLIKTTSQIKNRVIPLETVSPEFDVLTGIRGMASLLGNKPKPMIFKSNTSKLAKAERMGIPKGERNSPSPYKQIGTVDEVSEHYMKATGDIFGPFMDKQSEHAVFNHATDPSKIVKVYAVNDKGFADIAAIKEFQAHYMKRNQIPFGVKNRFSGYLKGKDGIFPVYTQDKVTPLKAMNNTQYEKEIFPKLVEQLKAKGYTQTSPDVFSNGKFKITDLYPDNMGYDSQGNLIFFDAKTYRFGGLLGRRHRL